MRDRRRRSVCPRTIALLVGMVLVAASGAGIEARADNAACLSCHSGGALDKPSLDVKEADLAASVHGSLGCTDCHAGLASGTDFPHPPPGAVECGSCHDTEKQAMARAAHRPSVPDAPRCWSCHGAHDVRPANDKGSRVAPLNQPGTCLACHADARLADQHGIELREPREAFEKSTHYQQLLGGNGAAPTCSTCHGAHDNLSHKDPNAPITRPNVAGLCGACHAEIGEAYGQSVHGTALVTGNADTPTCTGCHREHAIQGPSVAASPVNPVHVAQTCSHCHDDEKLADQNNLSSSRLQTYLGSYHGAANKFGDATVADCASCHGAHDILPSRDPRSMIHPSNLVRTCGKCHPQAGQHFASGKIHVSDRPEDNYWAWLVKKLYTGAIYGMIGIFVALILVDLFWRGRRARREGHA